MIFQYPGIGDSKSVKQARDMDIPEIWKHSPGINPYPGNGGNTSLTKILQCLGRFTFLAVKLVFADPSRFIAS